MSSLSSNPFSGLPEKNDVTMDPSPKTIELCAKRSNEIRWRESFMTTGAGKTCQVSAVALLSSKDLNVKIYCHSNQNFKLCLVNPVFGLCYFTQLDRIRFPFESHLD